MFSHNQNFYYYLSQKPSKQTSINNCIRLQENRFPKKIQLCLNTIFNTKSTIFKIFYQDYKLHKTTTEVKRIQNSMKFST